MVVTTPDNIEKNSHVLEELVEPVNRHLHIPLAARLVAPLVHTPVTPNQVTGISVLFGLGAAWSFSLGTPAGLMGGGLMLEISLILDCVDGQLARAKNMSSELGRIIDGVGGYIANLAVVAGIALGYPQTTGLLIALTVLTILRAIAFDFCKQAMTTLIQDGRDWAEEERLKTEQMFEQSPGVLLALYKKYLGFQQSLFKQRGTSGPMTDDPWTADRCKQFYRTNRNVLSLWKWNGPDLVFFALALGGLTGPLPALLLPLTALVGLQLVSILWIHKTRIRYETSS